MPKRLAEELADSDETLAHDSCPDRWLIHALEPRSIDCRPFSYFGKSRSIDQAPLSNTQLEAVFTRLAFLHGGIGRIRALRPNEPI